MDKERFLASGLLEQYVLKLTTPEETQEVDRYAKAFPEIQAEIEALQRAIEQYAMQYTVTPPTHLKDKVLSEVNKEAKKQRHASVSQTPGAKYLKVPRLQAAAMFLAVAAIGWLIWQDQQMRNDYQRLSEAFVALQEDCDNVRREHEDTQRVVAFLQNNDTRTVHLQGTAQLPEAHVVVYWNEKTHHAYLKMVNMPPPPQGKQYQIWADVDGEMINAGILTNANPHWQEISVIDRAQALNITIEPLGGSDHPTVALLIANGKM